MLKDEVHACLLVQAVLYIVLPVRRLLFLSKKNKECLFGCDYSSHYMYSSLQAPAGMLGPHVTACIACRKGETE